MDRPNISEFTITVRERMWGGVQQVQNLQENKYSSVCLSLINVSQLPKLEHWKIKENFVSIESIFNSRGSTDSLKYIS